MPGSGSGSETGKVRLLLRDNPGDSKPDYQTGLHPDVLGKILIDDPTLVDGDVIHLESTQRKQGTQFHIQPAPGGQREVC